MEIVSKNNNHLGKNRSKLPGTFTHGKMCYSRFSKNSVKNLTFAATKKPTKRTLRLITGNIHIYMNKFPRIAIRNYYKFVNLQQQKFILSPFRRLEVQSQCVRRIRLPPKALEQTSFLPLPGFWSLQQSRVVLGLWLYHSSLPPSSHDLLCIPQCLLFCLLITGPH